MPETPTLSAKSTEDSVAAPDFNARRYFNLMLYTSEQVREQLRLFNETIPLIFDDYKANEDVSLQEHIRKQNEAIELRRKLYAKNKKLYQKCQDKERKLEEIKRLIDTLVAKIRASEFNLEYPR